MIEIHICASPARMRRIQLREAWVGARNLPIARMHKSVVNTIVLIEMISRELEPLAIFSAFLKI